MTAPLTSRVVSTRLGRVEAAVTGDAGPAVLVVHGTPGDWRQARALATDLAGDHRVVLPTRPGYGGTGLRRGRSPQQQADLFAATLDALDIDRAVVVGISGGGPSAYAFASGHPAQCAGLVLCCSVAAHLMRPPTSMRALASVPGVWAGLSVVARAGLRRELRDPDRVVTSLAQGLSPTERELLEGDLRMRADLLAFAADRAVALRGRGLRNDTRQFAAAARRGAPTQPPRDVPVHVLHGDADTVVPIEHAREYARLIPGSVLEELPGYGHALPITARDRLAAVVRNLAARPAAAASSPRLPRPSP